MTTEKLAKGLLTRPGGPRFGNTHNAFVRFVITAPNNPEIRRTSRYSNNAAQFGAFVRSLRDVAQGVENLSPEGGDHPNPEYPWEQGGTIQSPIDYPFTEIDLGNIQMARLVEFIEDCLQLS